MKRVPGRREVGSALRSAESAVKAALKELNQQAGQLMARGDYAGAEGLASRGREIQTFLAEVKGLQQRWKGLTRGAGASGQVGKTAPLWLYYQPILKALVELDGEGTRQAIEPIVERLMKDSFEPGDTQPMARGKLRWQVMVQRARRHLATEGWLEPESKRVWRITAAGRKAAEAEPNSIGRRKG